MALVNNVPGIATSGASVNSGKDWSQYGFAGFNPYNSPALGGSGVGAGVSTIPNIDPNSIEADPTGVEQAQWEYEKQLELLAEQRAYNSAEAQKNREWQERMSNTAYQRAVEDLEKAGLNKWLAVTGGNGASASTPSGSSASSSAGDASAPNPSLLKAIYQFSASIATSVIRLFDFL